MVDTHCHLTFPDFSPPKLPGGIAEVLREAKSHGVTHCITVSTTTHDCLDALEVSRTHAEVSCTAGVHPMYSDQGPHEWGNLRHVASQPTCVAWGELGLDNHYSDPPQAVQMAVLEEQLAFIEGCHRDGIMKPVVLHCREAFDDLIPVLRRTSLDPSRFVFHCFTGTQQNMRSLLDFGAFVSFTGVITYRNAEEQRAAARLVPDGRFMAETDAPFLSPEPHRSQRPCRPWMTSLTARRLAEVRSVPFEWLHEQINATTRAFYGIAAK